MLIEQKSELQFFLQKLEVWEKVIKEKKILQELERAKNTLHKIDDSEDKSAFINQYISPLSEELKKIINSLNFFQYQPEQLKEQLINLKIEIENSFSLKRYPKQDLTIKAKKNRLLKLMEDIEKLKKLIDLLNKIAIIKADIQNLKQNQEQLISKIKSNDIKINNKSKKNQFSLFKIMKRIKKNETKIQDLVRFIELRLDLITSLQTNIEFHKQELKEKEIKINHALANIDNLENWSNSIWRRVINILTIGFFCSKKSVVNKRKNEYQKIKKMMIEKEKLAQQQNLSEIIRLNSELETEQKSVKEIRKELKEHEKNLDNFYLSNKRTRKIKALEKANFKKKLLVEQLSNKIKKQWETLWPLLITTIDNNKSIFELQQQLTARQNKQQALAQQLKVASLDNFKIAVTTAISSSFDETIKTFLLRTDWNDSGVASDFSSQYKENTKLNINNKMIM